MKKRIFDNEVKSLKRQENYYKKHQIEQIIEDILLVKKQYQKYINTKFVASAKAST